MSGSDVIQTTAAGAGGAGLFPGWQVTADERGGPWTIYRPGGHRDVDVGFKIHVSASLGSAAELLTRVLPILDRSRVPFKHAATVEQLAKLSSGRAGTAQVGKFLTAYPPSSPAARELAWELHHATKGLSGPLIIGDVPLVRGSLVHFRYGAFTERWLQLPTGRISPARPGDDGLEPDDRDAPGPIRTGEPAPYDADDAAGAVSRLAGGRYLQVQRLHSSPKGSTWLGFSLADPGDDLVVIKQARAFVMEAADGSDARRRLRHEADVLRALSTTGVTPAVVDYWDEDVQSFLVYRLLEGPTFAEILTALSEELTRPPIGVLRDWTARLCDAVRAVHDEGLVVGDIKPANLIVTASGFQFVDLELAGEPTADPVAGIGTPGYTSPQQGDPRQGRAFADDIYAIGATLLSAALLVDASAVPDSAQTARYELARDPQNAYLATVARCLAPSPADRPDSVAQIHAAVRDPRARGRAGAPERRLTPPPDYPALACAVGDTLLAAAVRNRDHVFWVSEHPIQAGRPGRDLYAGSAGTALFLAALHAATGNGAYLDAALGTGRWLWETSPSYHRQLPMPGLYFGDCGPGLLYLELDALTGDDTWAGRARMVADSVDAMPTHSPDLMTGEAGTALYYLALDRALRDESMLARAEDIAKRLAGSPDGPGFRWTIPPGHEGLSGQAYVGMSHGTAGIGYAITEYAAASGDADARRLSADIAEWLIEQGTACLPDGRGLTWTASGEPGSPRAVYWCHGAPGIARFLVHAFEVTGESLILDAATRAGRTVIAGSPWCGTSQCHGLAGNAEALIDIWQATGDGEWLRQAELLGENLAAHRDAQGWPTEYRDVFAPDLLVGQSGVGAAFLRLAAPHSAHLLSPAAFTRSRTTDTLETSNARTPEGRADHAQHAEERTHRGRS